MRITQSTEDRLSINTDHGGGIDLEIWNDGDLYAYAETWAADNLVCSADETPDVLLAIQTWIENLPNKRSDTCQTQSAAT